MFNQLVPLLYSSRFFCIYVDVDAQLDFSGTAQNVHMVFALCQCQNRRISGRGSRIARLRSMVTGERAHDVYPGSGPLYGGNTLLRA